MHNMLVKLTILETNFPLNANFFSDKNLVSDYFSRDNSTHNRTCHWAAAFNLIF